MTEAGMDPVALLIARDQHGIKFGLDGIRTLCGAIGDPQRAWTSLIVAGTNGKGSVTAMAAAALTAAGHRTGRYTSPHLVSIEERFAIDGRAVTREALGTSAAAVLEAEARCLADGRLPAPLTFFEITTAAGFDLFRRAGARVVVLEVGMGGRFDATNAADPAAAAITSIALDHTRFLGATLGAIAFEKAGVMRQGRPVVVGPLPPEAAAVVRREAAARGARLVEALDGVEAEATLDADGTTRLALRTPNDDYGRVRLALGGRHQVTNAIVAVRLLEETRGQGLHVPREAVLTGLTSTVWPGRLQELTRPGGGRVLIDAAHNPAGAAALAAYLAERRLPPLPIVFGAMKDKDVGGMLRALAPHASRFVVTQARSPRAMAAAELAAVAGRVSSDVPCRVVVDPRQALDVALADSPLVVLAGSIFLLGDVLPWLGAAGAGHRGDVP